MTRDFGRISSRALMTRRPSGDDTGSEDCGNCEARLKKAKCSDG
jgi:hypothetical protein